MGDLFRVFPGSRRPPLGDHLEPPDRPRAVVGGVLRGMGPVPRVAPPYPAFMPDAATLARRIEAELRRTGTPERAAGEKQYLKSDLHFLGTTLADIRRVVKEASRDPRIDREPTLRLAEEL